ncbi:hypothetical protein FKM82_017364, partial [Ascaphus truei]
QAVLECDLSMRFLEKALATNIKYHGNKSLEVALSHHLITLVYTSKAEFRSAMQHEKETYTIYKALLGDSHARTRESSLFLKHVTQQAVNLQRTMNEIYKNGSSAGIPHVQVVTAILIFTYNGLVILDHCGSMGSLQEIRINNSQCIFQQL